MRWLFATTRVSPCLCLRRKSFECLLHKRDKAGWTRGEDEAISRYGSHDVTLVGDVERIECRLERIKADWTQDQKAALRLMIWVLPPLLAALVAGLGIGIVQAATQLQDQTLPLTVKLLVVVAVLVLFAPVLSAPLIEQAQRIFTEFPALTARY